VKTSSRLRFLAWLCVVAVLVATVSPGAAGLPQAILAPTGAVLGEPSLATLLRGAQETLPPDLLVLRGVAARAPPLA
jgi:hypothetical protein